MAILLSIILFGTASAQLNVTSIEKIPLPATEQWSHPIFSPSGSEVYVTTASFDGIWQIDLSTNLVKEITHDRRSGLDFSISDDGKQVSYRRNTTDDGVRNRSQESVVIDLLTMKESVLEKGNDISVPRFIGNRPTSIEAQKANPQSLKKSEPGSYILGIDNTKISLVHNGTLVTLDPYGDGQYIWPVLSPDHSRLAAVEMDRGAFVCGLDGNSIVKLGRCNAPSWTHDGKWIIGMDDRDDGEQLFASTIMAVSPDGKYRLSLTDESSGIALFPSSSPVENKIVFTNERGELFLLSYEETK